MKSPDAIEVAAGLVFHEGRLLITQRPVTGHLPNLWEFPGGKREANESLEQCLKRELREELAIEVKELERFEQVEHTYPEKTVSLCFFRCQLAAGQPRALACQDFRWIQRENLVDYEFPEADARLLARLCLDAACWIQR